MIEYSGINSIENLSTILKKHKTKRIFLITGKNSYQISSAKQILTRILRDFEYLRFSEFSTNPKIEDIKKGLKLIDKDRYDVIIAIGGGSVIDIAKSISIFSTNKKDIKKYIKNEIKIEENGKILICIPTTSGSGSEATHFAVIYINKTKYSLSHKNYMLPDYSIIDPQFTFNLPKKITANTGMDALTQAIESYWSINSTVESKKYSEKAINLLVENIIDAVNNPSKIIREKMSFAANYAGKAINISKTTACHAVSYPFTSNFNIAHGQAVALTLPSFILYNAEIKESDILDPRGVEYVRKTMKDLRLIFNASDFIELKKKIETIMIKIGLKVKLRDLNINYDDLELIFNNGFNLERMKNNPRKVREKQLRTILEGIT